MSPGVGGVDVDHRALPHIELQLIKTTTLSTYEGCQEEEEGGRVGRSPLVSAFIPMPHI